MRIRQFIRLNDKLAISADLAQWILERRGSFDKRRQCWNWEGISFVASNRDTLLRVIRETKERIEPEALKQVGALPFNFTDWRQRQLDSGNFGG